MLAALARSRKIRLLPPLPSSIPLGGALRGEVGYLNQYRFGRNGGRDLMDHVATFTLSLNVSRLGEHD